MTRFQRMLYAIGFGRFKGYRRWIGGRWVERYIEPTPHTQTGLREHSSKYPSWRWEQDPDAQFDDRTHAIEQWPIALPQAHARQRK